MDRVGLLFGPGERILIGRRLEVHCVSLPELSCDGQRQRAVGVLSGVVTSVVIASEMADVFNERGIASRL
jgi:hypothetical protein